MEEARTAPRIDRYTTDEHGCELDRPCYMVELAGDDITVTGELFFPVVMR